MQEIGHEAWLKTPIEGTGGKLVGKLPAGAGAHANNLCHCLYVGTRFDSQNERLSNASGNNATENIVDDLYNLS